MFLKRDLMKTEKITWFFMIIYISCKWLMFLKQRKAWSKPIKITLCLFYKTSKLAKKSLKVKIFRVYLEILRKCPRWLHFILLFYHFQPLTNIQTFICNFASQMITTYFSRTAYIYQTASRWDLSPYRITIWLIEHVLDGWSSWEIKVFLNYLTCLAKLFQLTKWRVLPVQPMPSKYFCSRTDSSQLLMSCYSWYIWCVPEAAWRVSVRTPIS